MAQQGTVLVTGATGGVGGQVVRQLVEAGVPVRALARNPEAADLPAPVAVVRGDLSDAGSLDAALDGVDSVFLLFPTLQADAAAPEVIAKIAGYARRVVYLSTSMADSEQAEKDSGGILGSHRNLERLIRNSGLEWTFLRPGGFAKNTLMWTEQLRAGDVLRWFHGGASRSLIHEADIAAVAVRVLTEEGHNGAAYHLTGPARLTQVEQLAAIGEAIGRPLRFEELSPEVAIRELFTGVPTSLVRPIVDGHAEMVHHPEEVTDVVQQLTGHPARSFAQWAADHADDFR